jgi:hypothetical protein
MEGLQFQIYIMNLVGKYIPEFWENKFIVTDFKNTEIAHSYRNNIYKFLK